MQKIIRSEFSIYTIVGVITTLLNYATYFILLSLTDQSIIVSNIMAWVIAVLINSAGLPNAPIKISASIIAAVLNYFVSRYCVFSNCEYI